MTGAIVQLSDYSRLLHEVLAAAESGDWFLVASLVPRAESAAAALRSSQNAMAAQTEQMADVRALIELHEKLASLCQKHQADLRPMLDVMSASRRQAAKP